MWAGVFGGNNQQGLAVNTKQVQEPRALAPQRVTAKQQPGTRIAD